MEDPKDPKSQKPTKAPKTNETNTKAAGAASLEATKADPGLTPVRCYVRRRNAFNVTGGPFAIAFTGWNLRRGKKVFYAVEQEHVMPFAHAADLMQAGVVAKGSAVRLPLVAGKSIVFSGIEKRDGEPDPIAPAIKADEFEAPVTSPDELPADKWEEATDDDDNA